MKILSFFCLINSTIFGMNTYQRFSAVSKDKYFNINPTDVLKKRSNKKKYILLENEAKQLIKDSKSHKEIDENVHKSFTPLETE